MKVLSVLTRIYLLRDELAPAISFYENLFGQRCSLRFSYAAAGLELAQVGAVLLLAGSEAAMAPFRSTQITLVVDSLEGFQRHLEQAGAQVIHNLNPCRLDEICASYIPTG